MRLLKLPMTRKLQNIVRRSWMDRRKRWHPRKDGVQAGFTLMYPASDSVRQALAADTANQLKELGIQVSIEGVGWDTAYDRAQSTPLMWGWGAHTPMEFTIFTIQPRTVPLQSIPHIPTKSGRIYGSGPCKPVSGRVL